ncbi:TRAP transporter substrate-binding protein [Desulfobacula phenolica]|uniref:TRAP-type C4-dicarboxylate transport system, substrate-binding protein n=1 Tax=Desulfobacula phenolica TaxID=90732 RepID=A0A1H2DQD3_9BACT|nr:TRAP transporter substrate-binding protein [Desulfobacula phenolica]SDT84984.1 TRAP-type C4-dicarboxylate transport system, substrate-binding protein [Desulfobacula phenolica]
MKINKVLSVFVMSLLLVMGFSPVVFAKTTSLNYANFPPAPTFPCIQMERWKTQVEERTHGAVAINTFPGGTLLGAKDMMDGVINGQADIGCICMAYQPGRFTTTNATSLPLGIPDAKTGSLVLLDLYNKYQPRAFEKVKVLTMFVSAPANIMSKYPVKTLSDLKGLDLRASGGAAQILKSWGANQIGMPMSATPEALQKGVVNGLFSSLEVMKDLKFAEICRNVTMTNTVIYPFAVIMNKNKWNALPEDVKKIMDGLVREQSAWTGEYMDNHVEESINWSKQTYDINVINLSDAEKTEWDNKLAPIIENWIDDANKKNLPGDQIVTDIKNLIKTHR